MLILVRLILVPMIQTCSLSLSFSFILSYSFSSCSHISRVCRGQARRDLVRGQQAGTAVGAQERRGKAAPAGPQSAAASRAQGGRVAGTNPVQVCVSLVVLNSTLDNLGCLISLLGRPMNSCFASASSNNITYPWIE
jgi:hypothetical protein